MGNQIIKSMKNILLAVILFVVIPVYAQITINFTDLQSISGVGYLLQNNINGTQMLDSAQIEHDTITFKVPATIRTGLYTATLYSNIQAQPLILPFIITPETPNQKSEIINLTTSFANPYLSYQINGSRQNEIYYAFLHEDNVLQQKQKNLSALMGLYSEKEKFYCTLRNELRNVKSLQEKLYSEYLHKKQATPAELFIKRLIEISRKQFSPLQPDKEALLFNSPVLMQWVWAYLSNYRADTLSKEKQIVQYKNATDTLAKMLNGALQYKEAVLKEIAKAYEQSGLDEVSLYIYQHQLLAETDCHADESIKIKAENLARIQVGNMAPNIVLDVHTDLYSFKAKYTLLVFWASWCSHCQELIPKLETLYGEMNKIHDSSYFQVLAISLDTSKREWLNYQIAHNLSWYNYCDFKAWKSKIAEAYCVSSTPTMFLLDKDKKIIAKPISAAELLEKLKVKSEKIKVKR